jgi:ApaG protein
MYTEITRGIQVDVQSTYISEQSIPEHGRFAFAYHVTITNFSDETVQLLSRHWVITDALGEIQEVRGPGVVGQQPVLRPGESHEYASGAVLRTPWGTMHGEYNMLDARKSTFDANIPCFMLAAPGHLPADRN